METAPTPDGGAIAGDEPTPTAAVTATAVAADPMSTRDSRATVASAGSGATAAAATVAVDGPSSSSTVIAGGGGDAGAAGSSPPATAESAASTANGGGDEDDSSGVAGGDGGAYAEEAAPPYAVQLLASTNPSTARMEAAASADGRAMVHGSGEAFLVSSPPRRPAWPSDQLKVVIEGGIVLFFALAVVVVGWMARCIGELAGRRPGRRRRSRRRRSRWQVPDRTFAEPTGVALAGMGPVVDFARVLRDAEAALAEKERQGEVVKAKLAKAKVR